MISDAMVSNYDLHQSDLKKLKQVFKPHPEIYTQLFKDKKHGTYDKKSNKFDANKNSSYSVYAGRGYQTEGDRNGHITTSQEDFNKYLYKLLEEIKPKSSPEFISLIDELLDRADTSEKSTSPLLLPKQRGQAKGTIPMQLHANELRLILEKLQRDFPSFAETVSDEDESYNTKAKKIAKIHEFRIPYYCGPLVTNRKSQFSWADEEISELIYPWNFNLVMEKTGQLDKRANAFIRRMTNECTYLAGEDVLPKHSLIYQKYMVLNELNNLKVNGHRIDNELKQKIFERGYKGGEIKGNITLKKLEKWCKDNSLIGSNDELSGTSEVKVLPKYQTYQDFQRTLGIDFEKKYALDKLEKVVEVITVLGEEKAMLKKNIERELGCDDKTATLLSKLSYKDWGRMSAKFLNGITIKNRTILNYLWEDSKNLMELLGQEVGFSKIVDEYNSAKRPASTKVSYRDADGLYCSPAVKRSVWQTIRIVNELTKNLGYAPKKIFLEVTRGEDEKSKGKYTLARKKDLETKLKAIKTEDAKAILEELNSGKYEDRDLQSKKLFLYFSQMGKCAYSGEPINIEELNNSQLYDIDHIFPRSKTKDDSITRNLVLVKASLNREKTNTYPIGDSIRSKMHGVWSIWYQKGLITKEKYERLIRATPLTNDELGGFIARQLVETSQSVKAIRDLLKRAYPETKIVMVKAGQVSDFRRLMSSDKTDRDGNIYEQGKYEFIKVRDINDLHHAKDAYLNIVVGNVMQETFTDNPSEWIKRRDGKEYSIHPEKLFRATQKYQKANGEETIYPEVHGWNFADSIKIISDTMKRNDVIWTRMNYIESKEISDLQLVGKGEKSDGLLRIKQRGRLDPKKYGGYNKVTGAFFALIEINDKDGKRERKIISIPIIYRKRQREYINAQFGNARIILPIIKYKSLFKINGVPLHITGKTGDRFAYQHGYQAIISDEYSQSLKKVGNILKKNKSMNDKYVINEDRDGIDDEAINSVFESLINKMKLYYKIPSLETMIGKIISNQEKFKQLDLKSKCKTFGELLKITSCGAERANLSSFVPAASQAGMISTNNGIDVFNSVVLIHQSPTGLYEEIIDLKTVQPKPQQQKAN